MTEGTYATVCNIHNPHYAVNFGEGLFFFKKAVQARPQRSNPGVIGQHVQETLRPDGAVGVDCKDIRTLFGGTTAKFVEGFVVVDVPPQPVGSTPTGEPIIDAPQVDVVGVYTSRSRDENAVGADGHSIEVETYHPKVIYGSPFDVGDPQ